MGQKLPSWSTNHQVNYYLPISIIPLPLVHLPEHNTKFQTIHIFIWTYDHRFYLWKSKCEDEMSIIFHFSLHVTVTSLLKIKYSANMHVAQFEVMIELEGWSSISVHILLSYPRTCISIVCTHWFQFNSYIIELGGKYFSTPQ